jgi:glyoxylase-like metal-dependent hydrolase (beta-lactamase superfamily II)/rhodanese-related sulfurtransferase
VVKIVSIPTPGLGNQAYLVGAGERAIVIDPPRDAWRLTEIAGEHGWRITHALETHVHNDYLSGALQLRQSQGSAIIAPAQGGYHFSHMAAADGFEFDLDDGGLVAVATPGHTPEHLSWQLRDGAGHPVALFSGGSLLIGGVGRTDLLGRTRTAEMTIAQFASMRRLAELPDEVMVYPTHGAGSFCVAGDADGPGTATIGALKRWNPAFAAPDLDAFDRELVEGRTLYPAYYRRMAPLNRRGPRLLQGPPISIPLTVREVVTAREAGVWLIDVRDRWAFAARHVAGSWNIELGDSLSAYLGWLLPFDAPICLVVDDPWQEVEAAEELLRIGFDHVIGHLHGGIDAWSASGGETRSYSTASWGELRSFAAGVGGDAAHILDVRQPHEWRGGVIGGSRQTFVADLPDRLQELDRESAWLVACRTGTRATIAASLLDAAGVPARPVVDGGVPALPPAELVPA